MNKTGYMNGSDMLVEIGGLCVGHCTTHSIDYSAETKEHAVKPVKTDTSEAGLYSGKSVSKLSISIDFEGLRNYDETEGGFKKLLEAYKQGKPVTVKAYERAEDEDPYLVGSFVITSLKETHPANDDSTYSGQLQNNGAPETFDPTKLSEGPTAGGGA